MSNPNFGQVHLHEEPHQPAQLLRPLLSEKILSFASHNAAKGCLIRLCHCTDAQAAHSSAGFLSQDV